MKYVKLIFHLLLGAFMTYAGISHLTFNRQEFVAQVPTWLQFSFIKYISDENHYKEVLSLVGKAKQTVHFLPFGLRRIPVWRGSSNVQTQ
jgi:hypothetical protein